MTAFDTAFHWLGSQRAAITALLIPFLLTSVLGTIVGTFLAVRVKDWLKRPRIRVTLSGVDMRFENIFNDGHWETSIAEMHGQDGTLEKVSNLLPFLERYLEIEMTLSNAPQLSVSKIFARTRDSKTIELTTALLAPQDHGFDKANAPLLDEHVTRKFYVKQSTIPGGASNVASIFVYDGLGKVHPSGIVRDVSTLRPTLDPSLFGWSAPSGSYELKQAPTRLAFGPYLGNIGPHIGCQLTPVQGSPYQAAIDDDEAAEIANFVKQLPDCERFTVQTVREGVILSDSDPLDEQTFSLAKRAIHIVDNGTVCLRFIEPPSTLESVSKCMLDAFALAKFLSATRFTTNMQRMSVGYWVGNGAAGILQPPGDSKLADIDTAGDFAVQCSDIAIDLLRANPNTPAKRKEIECTFAAYWDSIFPNAFDSLLPRRLPRGEST